MRTTIMLEGLHDAGNDRVWSEFDERYRPIVLAFAVRLGLDHQDAADVAQETLTAFLRQYRDGRYDRQRGRLQSWIVGIARNRIADLRRRSATRRERSADAADAVLSDDHQLTRIWEQTQRQRVVAEAWETLRAQSKFSPESIRAFERMGMDGRPAAAVAEELGITVAEVYAAKNRVASRLREIIDRLEKLYDA